jgi:hypothetical protein
VGCLLLLLAGALFAEPNPRELVRQSIANGERSWEQSFAYHAVKHEVDRQFDGAGRVKRTDRDTYEIIPLGYGSQFERHVEHDGEPVAAEVRRKQEQQFQVMRSESPAQKRKRFEKEKRERSYMTEVADAFDFRIAGEEDLPSGPAWVIEATPHPGYRARSRYAHMFAHMRGKLWIDKKDVQWVKADAEAMDTVTFGVFIARLAKGSHIVLEQMRLPDGAWVPKRMQAKASARTFVVFNHNFSEDITWSDYRRESVPLQAARVRR